MEGGQSRKGGGGEVCLHPKVALGVGGDRGMERKATGMEELKEL